LPAGIAFAAAGHAPSARDRARGLARFRHDAANELRAGPRAETHCGQTQNGPPSPQGDRVTWDTLGQVANAQIQSDDSGALRMANRKAASSRSAVNHLFASKRHGDDLVSAGTTGGTFVQK
jgi:hypothetical protein